MQEIQTVARMVTIVKAYFLCYINHNVSILAILAKLLSRLLAMQESYRYIYFIHTASTALLLPGGVLSRDIHASAVQDKGKNDVS